MEEIWIIGVGKFGQLAYERLSEGRKKARFVLVDPNSENLSACHGRQVSKKAADGVTYLSHRLKSTKGPNWIIPALPIHLAAEWALHVLGPARIRRRHIPLKLDPLLPNPIRGQTGDIYVSHATFRCPDDCAEPRDICTVTRKKRKRNMFEILSEVALNPFESLVIRSHQLGPGIGGYRPKQLRSLVEAIKRSTGPFLVSTACRCHGVITGLEKV